tara:strand:- start:500 stop:745 length:246 start_codon:yes stop_codon:yes gene_type:complete
MFGFAPLSEVPFSTLPGVGATIIVSTHSIPVEILGGTVLTTKTIPVEIVGVKVSIDGLKWVLSSRGVQWVVDPQELKWTIK